jgi:hypothetical protein
MTTNETNAQAGWRPDEWLKAAGNPFSRPKLYSEIRAGRLAACKAGKGVTIITTPPAMYYASLPQGIGPAVGRARKRRAAA